MLNHLKFGTAYWLSFLKFSRNLRKPISGKSREILFFSFSIIFKIENSLRPYIYFIISIISLVSKVADSEFFEFMSIRITRIKKFKKISGKFRKKLLYFLFFKFNSHKCFEVDDPIFLRNIFSGYCII